MAIQNKSFHVSNVKTINELYTAIASALHKRDSSPDTFLDKTITIHTGAGVFTLEAKEAERLYSMFNRWDKADSELGEEDGKISFPTASDEIVKLFKKHGMVADLFGVKISFLNFKPNSLWLNNKDIMKAYAKMRRLWKLTDRFEDQKRWTWNTRGVSLWRAATIATLSGFSSEAESAARNICRTEDGCWILYGLHDLNLVTFKSIFLPKPIKHNLKMELYINLSNADFSVDKVRSTVIHELGHKLYKDIAEQLGRKNITEVIIDWAKSRRQFRDVANRFERFLLQQDEKTRWLLGYLIEESLDAPYFRHVAPGLLKTKKRYWKELNGEFITQSQAQFEHQLAKVQSKKINNAFHLAMLVHMGESLGVENKYTRDLDRKVRTLLQKRGRKHLESYKLCREMMKVGKAYGCHKDFKAFADSLLPPSLKSKK